MSFLRAATSVSSTSFVWSCNRIISTSGVVIFSEAWKLELYVSEGLDMPKPPSLTGRASSLLVSFEQDEQPVSAGINSSLMNSILKWLEQVVNIWDCPL